MKKKITIICLAGSLLIIADSINLSQQIMLFLFNGIIPGTNLSLNPSIMFLLMIAAAVFVVSRAKTEFCVEKYDDIKKTAKQTKNQKFKHA